MIAGDKQSHNPGWLAWSEGLQPCSADLHYEMDQVNSVDNFIVMIDSTMDIVPGIIIISKSHICCKISSSECCNLVYSICSVIIRNCIVVITHEKDCFVAV